MNSEHNTWILDGIVDKNQASIDTSTKVLKEEKFQKAASSTSLQNFFQNKISSEDEKHLTCLKLKLVSLISRKNVSVTVLFFSSVKVMKPVKTRNTYISS